MRRGPNVPLRYHISWHALASARCLLLVNGAEDTIPLQGNHRNSLSCPTYSESKLFALSYVLWNLWSLRLPKATKCTYSWGGYGTRETDSLPGTFPYWTFLRFMTSSDL
jgi:hypothetical protein